jgi:hypothetical protein
MMSASLFFLRRKNMSQLEKSCRENVPRSIYNMFGFVVGTALYSNSRHYSGGRQQLFVVLPGCRERERE